MRILIYLIVLPVLLFTGLTVYSQKDIKMVRVESGSFEMGSDDEAFKDENPKHTVTLDAFYISQYEVLYDDYLGFCKNAGYSEPYGTANFPATNISWERAVMMCNWLSRRDGYNKAYKVNRDEKKGIFEVSCDFKSNGYRLPTEAEWEYAAKGGHRSKDYTFSGSNSPYMVAWFSETYQGLEHKSGELLPNELGLYDMSGNIAEWCWDVYDESFYQKGIYENPTGPDVGKRRVYRGGNRRDKMVYIEVTRRSWLEQDKKDLYVGFRVVRSAVDE